ncbi:MAG: hypothetical protein KDA78_09600 [Planctomycetaceae bacterium]|nr:hypothetical protein [Planctomycetaceae bacterium]
MKIIPVLDILNGQAVHAIGGNRSAYHPLQSSYCESHCPCEIAAATRKSTGLSNWYVADLDGIVHQKRNDRLLDRLAAEVDSLWLDLGIEDVEDLFAVPLHCDRRRMILATESLKDSSVLEAATAMKDPATLTFCLDLIDGQIRAPAGAWGNRDAIEIVSFALNSGVSEVIVLDVADVGEDRGPGTLELCLALRKEFPQARLVSGGGFRTPEHLNRAEQSGLDAILVGTAIHQQQLKQDDLLRYV